MIGLSLIAFECLSGSSNNCNYCAVNLIVLLLKTAMAAMDDIKWQVLWNGGIMFTESESIKVLLVWSALSNQESLLGAHTELKLSLIYKPVVCVVNWLIDLILGTHWTHTGHTLDTHWDNE